MNPRGRSGRVGHHALFLAAVVVVEKVETGPVEQLLGHVERSPIQGPERLDHAIQVVFRLLPGNNKAPILVDNDVGPEVVSHASRLGEGEIGGGVAELSMIRLRLRLRLRVEGTA